MPREVIQALSPREEEILRLAAEGFTDTAIAHQLGISEGTVGTYWGRIRTKLGPYPRTELIAVRVRAQLQLKLDELNSDRDMLEALLHRTSDAELLYEDVVDSTGEGVVVVDSSGIIEHANPSAHALFKYEPGKLRGMPLSQLVPQAIRHTHMAKFAAYCARSHEGHERFRVETTAVDREGTEFQVAITVAVVHRGSELLLTGLFERIDAGTKFRISVADLRKLGLPLPETLDRDGDGWIDAEEFRLAMDAIERQP